MGEVVSGYHMLISMAGVVTKSLVLVNAPCKMLLVAKLARHTIR